MLSDQLFSAIHLTLILLATLPIAKTGLTVHTNIISSVPKHFSYGFYQFV